MAEEVFYDEDGFIQEDRIVGVQNTFRYPEEVNDVIQQEYYRRVQEWFFTGKRKGVPKPTINDLVSEILRKGLMAMDEVKIPEDWNHDINRVYIIGQTKRNIVRRKNEAKKTTENF